MALFKITEDGEEWWVDSPTMELAVRIWRDETENSISDEHPGPDRCEIVTIDEVLRAEG